MVPSATIALLLLLLVCTLDSKAHDMFPMGGFKGRMLPGPHPLRPHPGMMGPGPVPGPVLPPFPLERPLLIPLPTSHASRKRMFLLGRLGSGNSDDMGWMNSDFSSPQEFPSRQPVFPPVPSQFHQRATSRRRAPGQSGAIIRPMDPRGSYSGRFQGMAARLNGRERASMEGGRILDLRNAFDHGLGRNEGRVGPLLEFSGNRNLIRRKPGPNHLGNVARPGGARSPVNVVTRRYGPGAGQGAFGSPAVSGPGFQPMRGSTINLSGLPVDGPAGAPAVNLGGKVIPPITGGAPGPQVVVVESKPVDQPIPEEPMVPGQHIATKMAQSANGAPLPPQPPSSVPGAEIVPLSPDMEILLNKALAGSGVDIHTLTSKLNGSTGLKKDALRVPFRLEGVGK